MLSRNWWEYERELGPCVAFIAWRLGLEDVWQTEVWVTPVFWRGQFLSQRDPASPLNPVGWEHNWNWQEGNSGQRSMLQLASVAPCVAGGHWSGLFWNTLKAEWFYCMGLLFSLLSYVREGGISVGYFVINSKSPERAQAHTVHTA